MSSVRQDLLSSARVAIIDDDDDLRDAFELRLRRAGYGVVGYDRADQALSDLESKERIDLILLDLRMPGMDGWTFRIEQKTRAKLRDVPVIALSADSSSYAKAIDADAYLTKPLDFDELETVVGRVLIASERRRLLAKSMELERVRALGTLVASVAHEINNPLTYVLWSLDLASAQARELQNVVSGYPDVSVLTQHLANAADGAMRIASVVRLLSTFSRSDAVGSDDVDVLRAIQAAIRLASHQIGGNARLREALVPVPRVRGNEGRLAQVVLNLLVNAAQALTSSPSSNAEIRIATRSEDATVVIEVSDSGPGVDLALLEKIFEPFFTTKPAGMGTGLGLSISRDIVVAMGGSLTVESVVGHGSTFSIRLPVATPQGDASDAQNSTGTEASGVRRILVVDDEPVLGRMIKLVLAPHRVDVCQSPCDALKLIAAGEYDLMLCDFKMPEMTGLELYRELRPKLQSAFVLMTGSFDNAEVQSFARTQGMRILRKPFSTAELLRCLNSGEAAAQSRSDLTA